MLSINDTQALGKLFEIGLAKKDSAGYKTGMITPAQCRAARALLDWSQQQLADASKAGVVTVRNFEGGKSKPINSTLEVLRRALESAGVEFVAENGSGAGVRLRKSVIN
jgi:ribosome-binding protein aMBF1 (putative translation factor)